MDTHTYMQGPLPLFLYHSVILSPHNTLPRFLSIPLSLSLSPPPSAFYHSYSSLYNTLTPS